MIILRLGLAAEHQSLSWLAHHFTKGGTSKEVAMMSKAAQLSEIFRETRKATELSASRRGLVMGLGINDADYITNWRRESCPAYAQWSSIFGRCYRKHYAPHQLTYSECIVDEAWHRFSEFRKWWIENHVDGWHIDKDLLVLGNKIYGPDTCCFVPRHINNFIVGSNSSRGSLPIGVSRVGSKFRSHCGNGHGAVVVIGVFDKKEDAHIAWRDFKLNALDGIKAEADAIDVRIYETIKKKIMSYSDIQP
jgi:hypothetical protein